MRSKSIKKYTLLIGVLFLFPLSWLLFFGVMGEHKFATLPYVFSEVQGTDSIPTVIRPFELTDQSGHAFSSSQLKGKVWLASFYGTNNPYIGKITRRLLWPNFRYREEEDIILVSFSMDTEYDTPEVLAEYIKGTTMYQRLDDKWYFLTGDQSKIHNILKIDFRQEDIENTSVVFLVDTEGCVRGRYNGNREDEIKGAIEDIALLKKEMDIAAYEEKKKDDKNNED